MVKLKLCDDSTRIIVMTSLDLEGAKAPDIKWLIVISTKIEDTHLMLSSILDNM